MIEETATTPENVITLNDLFKAYKDVFETDDVGSIALMAAIIVGSKLKTEPVWLFLIGPSSGGKSALIEVFTKVKFITQLSDLTPNTFLSGMASKKNNTSLLSRLGNNFVITMKDFTTILSKSSETQEAIMAQMREIYDGLFTKETGNGQTLKWGGDPRKGEPKGHATFIMASTEAIFAMQEKYADMGTRAINYVLLPQQRKATLIRALRNNDKLHEMVTGLQDIFEEFIMQKIHSLPAKLDYVSKELEDKIVEVADFSAICRSVVLRDYKGAKNLALSAEMPMRIGKQLLSVAQLLTFINDGELTPELENVVYKIGLDSIPKQRRIILETMARYDRVSVTGMAGKINYPEQRTKEWLDDLHMFKIVEIVKVGHSRFYKINADFKSIMIKYAGVIYEGGDLEGDSEDEYGYGPGAGNYDNYVLPEEIDMTFDEQESRLEKEKQIQAEWDAL